MGMDKTVSGSCCSSTIRHSGVGIMARRALSLCTLVVVTVLLSSCDLNELSTIIVTAQVAKTLDPASNTASILVGKATVQNILRDDWMVTPDPGDTSFWSNPFPAKVEPIGDCDVAVNGTTVGQKLPGAYFQAGMVLQYMQRYDLTITTPDARTITARGVMPDSFSIILPRDLDSFDIGDDTLRAAWSKSDSAETYLVGIAPADSGSPALGWSDALTDTACVVPHEAFEDSIGVEVAGKYVFSITAVNGGWNKSGLDLFLSGGNLSGASGTFGCAVYPKPIRVIAR
jgi:hypothetical protein